MSVRAHQVCDHPALSRLNRSELLTLCRLLARMRESTGEARPGIAHLAERTQLSESTVRRAIRGIESAGVMKIQHGGGRGLCNVYRFKKPTDQSDTVSDDKPCQIDDTVSKPKPCQNGTETLSKKTRNPVTLDERPTEERRNGVIHSKPKRQRPLWDSVVRAFKLSPVTKAERSRVGRIVRDLEAKGAAPDDVDRRLQRYRLTWPKAADTPEALLKHWDRFAEAVGILDADPVTPPDEVFYE